MSFYTYVGKERGRILHRYIDDDGITRNESIADFPFELYIESNKGEHTGLHGEKLAQLDFSSVSDLSTFIYENGKKITIHGMADPVYQFISKTYPGKTKLNLNQIRVLNYDIEVETEGEFPDPWLAEKMITSITVKLFGGRPVTFGLKPLEEEHERTEFIHCKDEIDLLKRFVYLWRKYDPHVITGWNIDIFDTPYFINRIKNQIGEELLLLLSPFKMKPKTINVELDRQGYEIIGVTALDYIRLYSKFSPSKPESLALGEVGENELGMPKVDISDYNYDLNVLYRKNYPLFVDYNVVDVEIPEGLDEKLNFISLAFQIAFLTKCKLSDVYGTVGIWDCLVYNMLRNKNIPIPPKQYGNERVDFSGGYVKEPKPSMYGWTLSFDLTALYPSIIRMFNMSPETFISDPHDPTFVDRVLESLDTLKPEESQCVCGSGAVFSTEKEGIMAAAMAYVFNERKAEKDKMLVAENNKDHDLAKILDAAQQALKVVANGGYGAMANPYFRYYAMSIAQGITMSGQLAVRFIEMRLNRWFNQKFKTENVDYAIGMDTDSVYLNVDHFVNKIKLMSPDVTKEKIVDVLDAFAKNEVTKVIEDAFGELAEKMGCNINLLEMKREVIAESAIWRGKKNYAMLVWDKEGVRYSSPKLKIVGLEAKKSSSFPKAMRAKMEEAIRIILASDDQKELQKMVANYRKMFYNDDEKNIAFVRKVTDIDKWLDEQGNFKSKCPIHVRAAVTHNQRTKQLGIVGSSPAIQNGAKLRFVYLQTPNEFFSDVVAFTSHYPREFDDYIKIDRSLQFEKAFEGPVQSLAKLRGWSTKPVANIMGEFGDGANVTPSRKPPKIERVKPAKAPATNIYSLFK